MPTPFLLNGILASQISGHLYAGPTGAFDALGSVTVGAGGQSSITFSAIPQTYTHLQLRGSLQDNRATYGFDDINLRFNSDSGTNYARHYLGGDGGSAYSGAASTPSTYLHIDGGSGSSAINASMFGAVIIDILDYANTNKLKTLRALGGADNNGSGRVVLSSGLWFKAGTSVTSDAINSISIYTDAGSAFNQYSTISLYGVK